MAVAAPAALAAALIAAGCGGDSEPDPVASATVAVTASTPGSAAGGETTPGGERTVTTSRGAGASTTAGGEGASTTPGGTGTSTAGTATTPRGAGTATTARGKGATTTTGGSSPPPPPPAAKRPATTPAKVPVPAARAKLGRTQRFSGTGDRTLGTLKLDRNAVVRWTVSGATFELRDGAGKLKIAGTGKTGQTFAASGSYRSVKVTASGRWTLSFTSLGS